MKIIARTPFYDHAPALTYETKVITPEEVKPTVSTQRKDKKAE